jgi:hypothetical protein
MLYVHLSRVIDDLERRVGDRFQASDKQNSLALAASDKAVEKAELASEKRFDGANEFRQTLADQAKEFVAKSSLDDLRDKLNMVVSRIDRMESKGQGLASGWGYLVAGIATLALIIGIWRATH